MNETEWIIIAIFAFAVGYGLAHFAKNIRRIFSDWGLFSFFLIPIVVVFLFMGAAFIADLHSVWISLAFAAGFIIRMIRQRGS